MSNFKLHTLNVYYYGDEIKKDDMRWGCGGCGLYEEEETYIQCFRGET
jgi:hypothetical protein